MFFKSVDGESSAIDAQCIYSISEEDVVFLNSEGKLVALKAGTTTLVAKYQNATAVLVVNVNEQTKQDITITFESGCEIPSFTRKVSGNTVILPSISERKGYSFDGWQTPNGVKKGGDSISAPKTTSRLPQLGQNRLLNHVRVERRNERFFKSRHLLCG
ncbi:MAG: InlB B-repeat-containing protein [Clostridiales bacterium]|nr:MAG: InlB B-repeat-containing protein [Clostridiales bacterium]